MTLLPPRRRCNNNDYHSLNPAPTPTAVNPNFDAQVLFFLQGSFPPIWTPYLNRATTTAATTAATTATPLLSTHGHNGTASLPKRYPPCRVVSVGTVSGLIYHHQQKP
jgi:hypothetical protein